MSFSEGIRSKALLAACGGDTVKLFDVNVDSGDPCVLRHKPAPGLNVNCVKWNHTNLVIASAGDDKKISLWQKNGQSMGNLPLSKVDVGGAIDEFISAINFSNKGSRYLCSGGSGRVVKIWDLQRKLCIKKLSGHTDTITGVMYNFKDEHLASISLKGDIIIHNLISGARASEFKDPNRQVLRVLDYSRFSRHLLVTAGDNGSVHLWDTTGRHPKVSWLKQHSAPTTGVCFSPSSDKIIASVGLDKKLYTFDSANKKSTFCAPYDAPFSSLAFRDDGNVLAAGTNSGRVVFYDVRGKPQPFTVLRAYNSSESVTSLCWQRSKPVIVNEDNCAAEVALLGGAGEDPILMPDPLPSLAPSSFSSASLATSRSMCSASTSGPILNTVSAIGTSVYNFGGKGTLSRLQATRINNNLKDDMDVFSPLVDVQPIMPTLDRWWDGQDEAKIDDLQNDKKSTFPSSSSRRFPYSEANTEPHPISDWLCSTSSMQDDTISTFSPSVASCKSESSFFSTPHAWVGNAIHDKLNNHRQTISLNSQMLSTGSGSSSSISAGLQDISAPNSFSTNYSLGLTNMHTKANLELPISLSSAFPNRYSTYADRISTTFARADGTSSATSSPKSKKTGNEKTVNEMHEKITSLPSKQDQSGVMGTGNLSSVNRSAFESQTYHQHGTGSSFSLQMFQRTLEDTLESMQQSIHEDVRNVHIELIRQFHMHEIEMLDMLNTIKKKQDDQVQSLRQENQQLRQLL